MQHHHPFPQQHLALPERGPAASGDVYAHALVGRPIARHIGRLELRDIMPIGGALLIVLGLGGGVATVPEILSGATPVTSLGFVPICVALGAILLWRTVRQMKQTLDVCERGFVYRIGGKEQIVPWSDVIGQQAIQTIGANGLEKGFRVVLRLRDGRKLSFTSWLANIHALHAHVSSFIAPF